MLSIFRKWTSTDVQERLQARLEISSTILSIAAFFPIFYYKLDLSIYFGADDPVDIIKGVTEREFMQNIMRFMSDRWHVASLALITFVWFYRYRGAVHNEIMLLSNLFPDYCKPDKWDNVSGRKIIPLLSAGLTVAFLFLAWYVDEIRIYVVIVVILNVMDIRGNTLVRVNLTKFSNNPRYQPREDDPHKQAILQRRLVAAKYRIERPQLERIGIMMAVIMLAFLLKAAPDIFPIPLPSWLAYPLVISAILANEVVMWKWRRQRDRDLEDINAQQKEIDRQRMNGQEHGSRV